MCLESVVSNNVLRQQRMSWLTMFAISEQCSICPLSSPLLLDSNIVNNIDDRKHPLEVAGLDGGGKAVEVESLFPTKTLPEFSE